MTQGWTIWSLGAICESYPYNVGVCQNKFPCNHCSSCKSNEQKEGLLMTSVHPPSVPASLGSLQGLPVVSTLSLCQSYLHTMQSQRQCNLISKLAQSGEIYMLIHFVITKNRGLMKFNQ